jgi:SAM-dependent methyltransferase
MDALAYVIEAEVQDTHWWFVGRRRLFGREIARLGLDRSSPVLDVGSGTGSSLAMLREAGYLNVAGLDLRPEAIAFCAEKGFEVKLGNATALPFPDDSFELVLATDVIEHLDADLNGLEEVNRVVKPGGHALVTVPAFPSLWGLQDRIAHHRRRYRMRPLLALVKQAGFKPVRHYYFNYLLFAPIWLARRGIDMLKPNIQHEGQVNSPLLNRLLTALFVVDLATSPVLRPPFGVSIFMLAKKPC